MTTKEQNLKLDDIKDFITESSPVRWFHEIKYSLRNMIFRGHNNVRLRKFSGKDWVETDTRLIEATFELLREFVEEQKSWMEYISDRDKYGRWTQFKIRYLPNRFRQQLSREMGLRHLDWEIELGEESPQQSSAAKKIKALYLWYMDEYDKINPWDSLPVAPGKLFSFGPVLEDGCRELLPNDGPEWNEYHKASSFASSETDRLYNEATQKAVEVLQLRDHLWT